MASDDLRALLNLPEILAAARPKMRTIPATTYTPEPTAGDPDPEPITVPERTEVYVEPTSLPEEIAPGGQVDLVAQVNLLHARLGQIGDTYTRVAVGRAVVTSGVYTIGQSFDVTITFDTPALAVPESGWVQIQPAIAWMGRTKAVVKAGSFTTAGCTVTVTALNAIAPSPGDPITYEAVALYNYTPPVS